MEVFFSITILLQLILKSYGIPGLGGTFADILLLLLCIWMLLLQRKVIAEKNTLFSFLPFYIYIVVNVALTWHMNFSASDQIIDWFRVVLYYYVLIFGVKKYFDVDFAYQVYEYMVIAATVFLIIQYMLVAFAGHYISGFWGPFALVDSKKMYLDFTMFSTSMYRPNSFFAEPAHYATFVIAYLCMNCLKQINLKTVFMTIFVTFGVLLSGSTTGLVLCAIIIFFWLLNFCRKTQNMKYFIVVIILALIAFNYVSQMESFKFMLYRTFETSNATESRLNWMNKDILPFNSIIDYFIGVGNCSKILQNGVGWLPGWILLLQYYGIIGVLIYCICSIWLFIKSSWKSRLLLITFWILGVGAEVLVDQHLLLFLSFAIADQKRESKIIIKN